MGIYSDPNYSEEEWERQEKKKDSTTGLIALLSDTHWANPGLEDQLKNDGYYEFWYGGSEYRIEAVVVTRKSSYP